MRKIIIDDNEKGQRFDRYVSKYLNKAGNSFVQKMIRKKNIELNEKKAKPDIILKKDDIVEFYLAEETINKFRDEKDYIKTKNKLNIIYEDNNVVIINKPIGITMQPDHTNEISLIDIMLSYLKYDENYTSKTFRPAFINRLDKNTSGIVIGAKNYKSLKTLNRNMRNKRIKKYYKGLVEGFLEESLLLEDFMTRNNKKSKINKEKGKKIITKINPIISCKDYSLLEVELITGRTHQIRAHMESIGHPLISDNKYNGKQIGNNQNYYLHAYKIIFQGFNDELEYLNNKTFEAELPEYFNKKIEMIYGDRNWKT